MNEADRGNYGHIAIINAMATLRSRLREGRVLIRLLCFLATKAFNGMTEVLRPVGQATPQHLYLRTIAGLWAIPKHLMPTNISLFSLTVRVPWSRRRQFLGCRWTRSGIRYGLSWGGLGGPHPFLQLYIYPSKSGILFMSMEYMLTESSGIVKPSMTVQKSWIIHQYAQLREPLTEVDAWNTRHDQWPYPIWIIYQFTKHGLGEEVHCARSLGLRARLLQVRILYFFSL